MTAPEPRVQITEPADSDEFPWVEDLESTWHHRPAGQPWVMDREDGANALVDCGRYVASVRVSTWKPDLAEDVLCGQCSLPPEWRDEARRG